MRPSLFSLCAPSGRRVGTSFLQPHHTQICRFQTIRGARYIPQYTVSVPAPSKQAALLEETMWAAKPGVRIYTDGSSMAGGVGAAAAMYVPGKAEADILHYHLGPSDQYDMYDADLVGLLLAIELLKRQNASMFVVSKPARTKEAGVEEEKVWVEKPGVRVYVDGSGQGGGIGAAAALYVPGILENSPRMLHYHMGRASQYTPYEADLVSIILGIELLWRQQADETCMEHGASIAADNLCAIFNPQRQTSQPGHYLFDELHRAVSRLQAKHPHTNLTFRERHELTGGWTVNRGGTTTSFTLKYFRCAAFTSFSSAMSDTNGGAETTGDSGQHVALAEQATYLLP
ncbi:hypothetical protein EUX98_g5875 [Antrodiella citrinella]|uniref:RNase H type-1 domain-containing protein n=1 Tax=Antrodiella citrinella TaxID=2447956 RepID=A0A4S4MSZ0_9APHY|nr:hypothetical protein EUX98_g5875 [Antrodiella citrinella]